MANEKTPSAEKQIAAEAAGVAVPDPRAEKAKQGFLNQFASDPKQMQEMGEMIDRKAPVQEWADKYLKSRDPVGTYARHFKAEVEKVIR